jgi:hypothetical protein
MVEGSVLVQIAFSMKVIQPVEVTAVGTTSYYDSRANNKTGNQPDHASTGTLRERR